MPDVTISAPVPADSVDRLTLGATDARSISVLVGPHGINASVTVNFCQCVAEE